jgi:hypothetical protein
MTAVFILIWGGVIIAILWPRPKHKEISEALERLRKGRNGR